MTSAGEQIIQRIDRRDTLYMALAVARAEHRDLRGIIDGARNLEASMKLGRRAAVETIVFVKREKVRLAELPFKQPEQAYNFDKNT